MRVMVEIIVLPVNHGYIQGNTCSHHSCFTSTGTVAAKIAPKSTIYRIMNFKERGSIVVKKASGHPRKSRVSPKENSATESGCQQCRACTTCTDYERKDCYKSEFGPEVD